MADPDDYDEDEIQYDPEPPDKYGTKGDADYAALRYEQEMNERRFRS